VIANCLVYGNSAGNSGGGLHYCNGTISNCTVTGNTAIATGGGLNNSNGIIKSNIIWGNSSTDVYGSSELTYCCYAGAVGTGNIDADPLFANPAEEDYHLLPGSPCIDTGDPATDFSHEPRPNGGRVNMGFYGNTPEATQSDTNFSPGGGTEGNPYHIWDTANFMQLMQRSDLWDKHYIQMADLDLSDPNLPPLTPIGTGINPFTGGFDGNKHSISHLQIIGDSAFVGMFGYLDSATVCDLTLIEPKINVPFSYDCIGALFGTSKYSDIIACDIINGVVSTNCSSVGLLGGHLIYSRCVQSSCSGYVEGSIYIGGLLGRSYGSNTITSDCTFEGTVVGSSFHIGGFVGNSRYSEFMRCGSKGTVSGDDVVGGFAGYTSSSAYDCYSQCDVSGSDSVGGFAGQTENYDFDYINCYSSGHVSGRSLVGGFMGDHHPDSLLDYQGCFWDAEVNPGLPGIGNASDPDLVGETTTNMQTEETYLNAGWDFVGESTNGYAEIWTIDQPAAMII
jgi:hypothetical protein